MYIRKVLKFLFFTILLVLISNLFETTLNYNERDGTIPNVFKVEENFEENGFCKSLFPSPSFNTAQIWHIKSKQIFNSSHHLDLQNIFQTIPAENGILTMEGEFMRKIFFEILTVSFSFGNLFLRRFFCSHHFIHVCRQIF